MQGAAHICVSMLFAMARNCIGSFSAPFPTGEPQTRITRQVEDSGVPDLSGAFSG